MDTDAYNPQVVNIGAVILCFDIFYSLIWTANICHLLSIVIINGKHLKKISVTANSLQWKMCIISLLRYLE